VTRARLVALRLLRAAEPEAPAGLQGLESLVLVLVLAAVVVVPQLAVVMAKLDTGMALAVMQVIQNRQNRPGPSRMPHLTGPLSCMTPRQRRRSMVNLKTRQRRRRTCVE
jgi:hypothetical protein